MKLDLEGLDYIDVSGLFLINVVGGVRVVISDCEKGTKNPGSVRLGLRSVGCWRSPTDSTVVRSS